MPLIYIAKSWCFSTTQWIPTCFIQHIITFGSIRAVKSFIICCPSSSTRAFTSGYVSLYKNIKKMKIYPLLLSKYILLSKIILGSKISKLKATSQNILKTLCFSIFLSPRMDCKPWDRVSKGNFTVIQMFSFKCHFVFRKLAKGFRLELGRVLL